MIRAKLEVNTARLKKSVLLAEVSTASRVSTANRNPVMSSSSTVTYTSVYTDSEPGRVFWGADEELSDGGSPSKPVVTLVYSRKPRKSKTNVLLAKSKGFVQNCSLFKFGNDNVAKILGYGDYQIRNLLRYQGFTTWKDLDTTYSPLDNGTEFVNQTLREYYEKVGISHETSVARSPQQNGVVERRNRTLIEAAHTMLIYAKASFILMGRSSCYRMLHPKSFQSYFIRRTFMKIVTPATISSGLMLNPPPSTPFVPPLRTDWDLLFQPLNSQITPETQSHILPNDVEEDNHDLDVAHMNNDPLYGIPIPENKSEASSSSDVIPTVVYSDGYYFKIDLQGETWCIRRNSKEQGSFDGILERHSAQRSLCQPTGWVCGSRQSESCGKRLRRRFKVKQAPRDVVNDMMSTVSTS
ncbi:retrovirus-related pol polyprotein from transposon TNT 1-94 [Tanacetum coccineum]|uniref:Retrovirus-related pol polyprotein from transposon TNT 1-94 n=1 Tax=Tanacetum coccineum TaxID=301880 RepID=A0ABQ5JAV7_9ASTR